MKELIKELNVEELCDIYGGKPIFCMKLLNGVWTAIALGRYPQI